MSADADSSRDTDTACISTDGSTPNTVAQRKPRLPPITTTTAAVAADAPVHVLAPARAQAAAEQDAVKKTASPGHDAEKILNKKERDVWKNYVKDAVMWGKLLIRSFPHINRPFQI